MSRVRPGLVRGSMIIAVALITAGSLSLLTSIILARSVSVADFGFYSLTASLQAVATIFAGFSIGTAIAKFVSEHGVHDINDAVRFARSGLRLVLVFSTVTAVVYFALADPIGNGLYGEPGVADLIPFSAIAVFSSAVLALASGMAQGSHRMRLLSSMQILTPLISLSIIVMLLPYIGIRIAFVGMFVAQITVALSAMYRLDRTGLQIIRRTGPYVHSQYRNRIMSFAIPAVIGAVMVVPLHWFGNTALALSSGFIAVGHFAVAMVFFHALSLLPSSLAIPLVPRVSEMSVSSRDEIESLISRSLRAVSVLFFPLFFAIALFSGDIVDILYGEDYRDSSEAVYLVVAACYYYAMATTVGAAIVGLGRMWVGLGLNMIWAIVFATTTLITVPLYGSSGLGCAYAVSYGVHLATSLTVSNKILHMRIRNVFWTIMPSTGFFVIGFLHVTGEIESSMLVKATLLTAGIGLMMHLGRAEIGTVLSKLFKRKQDLT